MSSISRSEAVATLNDQFSRLTDDDLVEVYNELFPEEPVNEDAVRRQRDTVVQRIVGHVRQGLETEEIVDLWNVVFPRARSVWYDEADEALHFDEPIVGRQPELPAELEET